MHPLPTIGPGEPLFLPWLASSTLDPKPHDQHGWLISGLLDITCIQGRLQFWPRPFSYLV